MVLPQPAAHDASGQAVGWADEIGLSLGLSGGGALALVDRARPARLGERKVRTLVESTYLRNDSILRRVFGARPKAKDVFHRWLESVPKPSVIKLETDEDPVGVWAAHVASELEISLAALSSQRAWALEPVLRRGGLTPVGWLAMAMAAATLGDGKVALRWAKRIDVAALPKAAAEHLRTMKEELDPIALLTALCGAAEAVEAYFDKRLRSTSRRIRVLHVASMLAMIGGIGLIKYIGLLGFLLGVLGFIALHLIARRATKALEDSELYRSATFIDLLASQARRAAQVRKAVERARELFSSEKTGEAEAAARDAVTLAAETLGEEHPLYLEAVELLASILLAKHENQEALDLLSPLIEDGREIPASLALLTARVLAGAGRAADAVRILAHLVGTPLGGAVALPPAASGGPDAHDPLLTNLLRLPAGLLAHDPAAHVALVEALLKQGRYPEALQTARGAVASFKDRDAPALEELRKRAADLERRLGPSA